MSGLLNIFNSEQGRMGLGLLGGGFGQQLRQGVESMDAYKKQQMIAQIQQLQMQRAQTEMADQVEKRKAQAAQLIEQQRLQSLFRNAGTVPANMQGTEAANAMLPAELRIGAQAQLQQPGKIDYNALRQQGMPAAMIEQLAKLQDVGMPEVARTVKFMQNGREVEQQFDKQGRPVGQGMEQFKAPISVRRGDSEDLIDPYTMMPRASFGINQSPDSKASNDTTRRGQNMTDARSKEANNIQQQSARTQIMQTPEGLIAIDKGRNQAVPVTMGGSPVRSEDAMKKTANAKTVLSLLDEAEKILPSSTGSAIGAGVDMAAGAAGMSTKGAQSIARLKSIEGQLIASMPRMEGPQSDADRMLYQQAAGDLANSMKPVKTRQAAAETLRKLQQKYVNPGSSDIQSLLDKYK